MPTFDFTAPDGKSYSVDGPDGATPEQAFQILQQHLGSPTPDSGGSIGGAAKQIGYGLVQGVTGLAGLPADLAHLYAPNQSDPNPLGSDALTKKVLGDVPAPQGAIEGIANKIGQFAPAVIGGPESLAAKAATRVLAPAIASEAGKQVAGPYGEVAGALAGAGGATAAANKFREMAAARAGTKALTGDELLKTGSNQFDQARNMDVSVKPDFARNTAQDMRDALNGYDPDQIKPVLNAVNRLEDLYKPTPANPYNTLAPVAATPPIDMNEVENIRKQLSGLRTSPDATLRSAAKTAQEALTKNQMALTAADAVSGDAAAYSKLIRDAVGNYGAGKRSMVVQGKAALADLNAATAGSGANVDNATRQAIKQLARPINNTNTPVWRKLGFNDAEGAAIERAARGTIVGNTARFVGKAAPTGIVSGALAGGAGSALGGPVGAVALPAAGYIAKKIGDLSTKKAVQAIDSLVKSRSPLAAQVAAQLPPAVVNQFPKKSAAILAAISARSAIPAVLKPAQVPISQ